MSRNQHNTLAEMEHLVELLDGVTAKRRRRQRKKAPRSRATSRNNTRASGVSTAQNMLLGNTVSTFRTSGDGMRGLFRGSIVILNTAGTAGVANYNVSLDFAGSGLGNISTVLGTMSALYRHFRIHAVGIKVMPITATTAGGYVAAGYEPSSAVGNPGSLVGVTDHSAHTVVPAGATDYLYITTPILPTERKLVAYDATSTGRDDSSFGTIQVWGNNSSGVAAGVAILDIAVDMTFIGPS